MSGSQTLCLRVAADGKGRIETYMDLEDAQCQPRLVIQHVEAVTPLLFDTVLQIQATYLDPEGDRCSLTEATVPDALTLALTTSPSGKQKRLDVKVAASASLAELMAKTPLGLVRNHDGAPVLVLSMRVVGCTLAGQSRMSLQEAFDRPEQVMRNVSRMGRKMLPDASGVDFMYLHESGHKYLLHLATVTDAVSSALSNEERPCRLRIEASAQDVISVRVAGAATASAESSGVPDSESVFESDTPAEMGGDSDVSKAVNAPTFRSELSPQASEAVASAPPAAAGEESELLGSDVGGCASGSEAEFAWDSGEQRGAEDGDAGALVAGVMSSLDVPSLPRSGGMASMVPATDSEHEPLRGSAMGRWASEGEADGAFDSDEEPRAEEGLAGALVTGVSTAFDIPASRSDSFSPPSADIVSERDVICLQVVAEECAGDESDTTMEGSIHLSLALTVPLMVYDKAIDLARLLLQTNFTIMMKYHDEDNDVCTLTEKTAEDALACACSLAKLRPAGQQQPLLRIEASVVSPASPAIAAAILDTLSPPTRTIVVPPALPVERQVIPSASSSLALELAEAYERVDEKDLLFRESMLEIEVAHERVAQAEARLDRERLERARLAADLQESQSRAMQEAASLREEHERKLREFQEEVHAECQSSFQQSQSRAIQEAESLREEHERKIKAIQEENHAECQALKGKATQAEKMLEVAQSELAAQMEEVGSHAEQREAARNELVEFRRMHDAQVAAKDKEHAELRQLAEIEAARKQGARFSAVVVDSELILGSEATVLGAPGCLPDDDPMVAKAKALGAESVFNIGKIAIETAQVRGGVGASQGVPVVCKLVMKNSGAAPWPPTAQLVHAEGPGFGMPWLQLGCAEPETTTEVALDVSIPQHVEVGSVTSMWVLRDVAPAAVVPVAPAIAMEIEWVSTHSDSS